MKKVIFTTSLLCFAFFLQTQVEKIELNGTEYLVTKAIPANLQMLIGEYTYEWGKETREPFVQLNDDVTGLYQPHMAKEIPIEF